MTSRHNSNITREQRREQVFNWMYEAFITLRGGRQMSDKIMIADAMHNVPYALMNEDWEMLDDIEEFKLRPLRDAGLICVMSDEIFPNR